MTGDNRFDSVFGIADEFSRIEAFAASSDEVCSGANRLEGKYYGDAGYRAKLSMIRAGFPSGQLQDTAAVFQPGTCGPNSESQAHRGTSQRPPRSRGGRTYVDDKEAGVLFLSSADMLQARFDSPRYISRVLSSSVLRIKPGCILISGSGTIGNTVIATDDFSGAYVSHDAFRVTPNDHSDLGMLYCFFQSTAGQFLLTRNKSGGVVEHIYEHDLNTLVVPLMPRAFRKELTRLIDDSCELRVKANRLLDEAQEQVQRSCYLPDLKAFTPPHAFSDDSSAELFVASAQARFLPRHRFGEVRLDATFHEPTTLALRKTILASDTGAELKNVVASIRRSALRQRTYVENDERGVPLVGGKELIHWRQTGTKYLSKVMTRNLEKEIVGQDWILVTCGGTIGRTMFVHNNFEGWCASEHIMRIVPDRAKCCPGFIYAFIASPFGQAQIAQWIHGSVIPQIRDFEVGNIAIRVPQDRGEAIHEMVVRAFDLRADARASEDRAISLFEEAIRRGRSYVEAEWGTE